MIFVRCDQITTKLMSFRQISFTKLNRTTLLSTRLRNLLGESLFQCVLRLYKTATEADLAAP